MSSLFPSYFLAGYECSTHRRRDGRRLDVVASTRHDALADADYARATAAGLRTAREGVRWHLVEPRAGRYDFSHELSRLRAARDHGVHVIWDLFHYGWPDGLDIWRPEFVRRFAAMSRAFAELLASEGDAVPWYAPVNEPSFVAWGAGAVGYLNPFARGRGNQLKRQLVRAIIAASDAVRSVDPRARLCHVDPLVHITHEPNAQRRTRDVAESVRQGMYEAWDMIAGRREPGLGGEARYLDVIGVNYYENNQWIHNGRRLHTGDPLQRPLREMLAEVYARYERPLFISETGCEDDRRASWLHAVANEVRAAVDAGTPVEGVCLYPVLNHPGWDDDRHVHCGLWDYADAHGERAAHAPLLAELQRQQLRFDAPAPVGRPAAVQLDAFAGR